MPRPRRKPRPPGNVHVICTGLGMHDRVSFPPPLQLVSAGERVRVLWKQGEGPPPVTMFRSEDGMHTFVYDCGSCPSNPKFSEDRFVKIAFVFAEQQGILGDDTRPIAFDISVAERL